MCCRSRRRPILSDRTPYSCRDEQGTFEARPAADLRALFGKIYGEETDWESRVRSAKLVANALNRNDLARATMTAVLMRLPDPDGRVRVADVDGVLAKAGFNPDEPRDERGRWTDGGDTRNAETDIADQAARVQLADAGMSDASDDAAAQAAARAAAIARHQNGSDVARDNAAAGETGDFWQRLGANLSNDTATLLSEIGRAQIDEGNADRAVADAETKAVAEAYGAYSRWMEQPIGGSVPITPDFPIWGYADDAMLAPERPITRGDAVAAATDLLSILPFGESASGAAEVSELGASESTAFIILPNELPAKFDIALPVGGYVIPTNAVPGTTTYGNLVGEQIGRLVQDRLPGVPMILRTLPACEV